MSMANKDSNALPPIESIADQTILAELLSTLFEPSKTLEIHLVPGVVEYIALNPPFPTTYTQLVDICAQVAKSWTWNEKAEFISGHPMIGEVKNLSALSRKEQGGPTPKVVLDRLAYLNKLYCTIYPGLRFITFVNGRTRAAIIPEFETICSIPPSPQPLPDDFKVDEPSIESVIQGGGVKNFGCSEWCVECDRGLKDVWRIAKARIRGLGLE